MGITSNKFMKKTIEESYKKIIFYRNSIIMSSCRMQKFFCEKKIIFEIGKILNILERLEQISNKECLTRQEREFTLEELLNYDGSMGKPAYVAINGVVYDVSLEPTWGGASHFGLIAGRDVTLEFSKCHSMQILERLNRVGILKQEIPVINLEEVF